MKNGESDAWAKPIVAILTCDRDLLGEAIDDFEPHFGRCDFRGAWHRFGHSSYYEAEMGSELWRCMLAFENIVSAWEAPRFKEWTVAVEERYSEGGHRRINCDPGYVDNLKVTLVSGKPGGHKVSAAPGIWVDYLLWYNKGWQAFPWAFPDFRDGTYFEDFLEIRKKFKKQVKAMDSSTPSLPLSPLE